MAVTSVPVRVNADLRPSRLVRSIPNSVMRSMLVIGRIFVTYKPFAVFALFGVIAFALGLALGGRFLYYYVIGEGSGKIQSVILAALLLGTGFFLFVSGIIADLISVNRKLLEQVDVRLRRLELMQRAVRAPVTEPRLGGIARAEGVDRPSRPPAGKTRTTINPPPAG